MIQGLTWPLRLGNKQEPLWWAIGGLGSLLMFLYLTFPYQALQTRILSELAKGTGWDIRAAKWSRGIPLGIEWHDMTWTASGGGSFPIQTMRIDIGVLGAIIGQSKAEARLQIPSTGQVGGGRAQGSVKARSWSFLGPVAFEGHGEQLDLAILGKPYITKGLSQIDIAQQWENRGKEGLVFKGNGSWKVEVKDLELQRIPVGTGFVPPLSFGGVNVVANCRDAVCDLSEFKADGPDGTVTAQGTIFLQQPFQSSTFELNVTVQAGAGWAQKAGNLPIPPLAPGTPLTFKLAGSFANPRLAL